MLSSWAVLFRRPSITMYRRGPASRCSWALWPAVLTICINLCKGASRKLGSGNALLRGRIMRSVRALQLFGQLAVVETHTL